MKNKPDINDTIAIMYADNIYLDDIKTTKIIINTLDLINADSDIIQAMIVVSNLDDICTFIHEVISDSNKVDEIYIENREALNLIHEYLSKKLNVDIYYVSEYDDTALTPNALFITKIDINGALIIIDIL